VSLLPLRARPDHRSEQISDAALGAPVRILRRSAKWLELEFPDGKIGHASHLGIVPCSATRAHAFSRAPLLQSVSGRARETARSGAPLHLPAGSRLLPRGTGAKPTEWEHPDGRRLRLSGRVSRPGAAASARDFVRAARGFLGVPYVWGGTTGWGLDCSGLVRLSAEICGISLPRDARDQSEAGKMVGARTAEALRPGDLLFFGEPGEITHVAIYLSGGRYIHASGCVRVNSLRPQDSDFLPEFSTIFRGARRIF
jgi:cell wall-associated NlpC family hydrolase